jgi:hypothetical protein
MNNPTATSASAYSTPHGQGTPISTHKTPLTSRTTHSRDTRNNNAMGTPLQEVSLDHLMHSIMRGMHTHSAALESISDFQDAESLEQLMILQVSCFLIFFDLFLFISYLPIYSYVS